MVHQLMFKSGLFFLPVLALYQASAIPGAEYTGQLERMGLVGVLFVFCLVLARKVDQLIDKKDALSIEKDKQRETEIGRKEVQLASKDDHLLEMTKQMNQSLTLQIESNRQVQLVMAESNKAKTDLSRAIDLLTARIGRLPCTEGERDK